MNATASLKFAGNPNLVLKSSFPPKAGARTFTDDFNKRNFSLKKGKLDSIERKQYLSIILISGLKSDF